MLSVEVESMDGPLAAMMGTVTFSPALAAEAMAPSAPDRAL
jgi:hypothetical protein